MAERWLEPLALLHGHGAALAVAAGAAVPLGGEGAAFTLARLVEEGRTIAVLPPDRLPPGWDGALAALARPLPSFAGIVPRAPGMPLVMGILNATPDSFSDGGRHLRAEAAVAAGHAMLEAGADILDVGGESTRPGAAPVTPEEEAARILPVVRALAPHAPVSIDTRHAAVMRAALEAGAAIVNDVTALRHDPAALPLVAQARCPVVLMHMPGTDPRTMQAQARYGDVALEVARHLAGRLEDCAAAGIPRERIALDPGIGFGKTLEHNLELIDRLPLLAGLGCPVLVGASRKRFVGTLSGVAEAGRRGPGSIGVALAAAARGAAILRVHDVAETVQALRVWHAADRGAA
ncbi:dihydropteroate synthase [Roseomonas sp. OT10]|uniref:dihydropteroate synthase n=1 Tax=Roseomonas cutis TaxID=2897332 RepID=UPI001E40FDCC|nr:dihydropteroate synthase [Roseomonas sp. OT10]UFN47453.1 dihydropteroate synthase [Roseomonas sp. OT10]